MRDKNFRIFQKIRMKAKIKKILANRWYNQPDYAPDSKEVGRYLNHGMKLCSCWICGNPRRFFKDKKTFQEKKFEQNLTCFNKDTVDQE